MGEPACNCAEFGGAYPDGSHLAFCPAHVTATCPRCQRAHATDPGRRCPRDARCAKPARHRGACWRDPDTREEARDGR